MKQYINKIITEGDESGNEMVVKFELPSGLEIFGLPTKNFYGGHWDLGPTWNYAVMADKPFLVDAGRFGQGQNLIGMMKTAGINSKDLEFVLISHSHEDHDGGLATVRTAWRFCWATRQLSWAMSCSRIFLPGPPARHYLLRSQNIESL